MKKYILSKKAFIITALIILIAVTGFSDEAVQDEEGGGYGLGLHFNLGLQIPDEPIQSDYGNTIVPGAGISFQLGRIALTLDYLRYRSSSVTPITDTNANMEINHFLLGIEYHFQDLFLNPSIGAGLSYSSLVEDVGEYGSFEDSGAGFFISGGISKRFNGFEAALKLCYSSVLIEEINIGGFFIIFQFGYNL